MGSLGSRLINSSSWKSLEPPVPVVVAHLAGFQVQLDGNIFDYCGQLFALESLSVIFAQHVLQLVWRYIFDMVVDSLEVAILLK